ncbi:MAG: aminoglycoside phosphotransferase family protein [Solirubrobacteraceae bacterium]
MIVESGVTGMLAAAMPGLLQSVREAIEAQVAEQPTTRGSAGSRNIDAVAQQLVGEAIAAGTIGTSKIASPKPFAAGNTAMMVGSVTASLDFVVKVDSSAKVAREARLLQRISTDTKLPELLRHAFPTIYAVADSAPLYGYLMEHLDGYKPLHETLKTKDSSAGRVLSRLWDDLLMPAYEATVTARRPDIVDDYIGRVRERFAGSPHVPSPDQPLLIDASPAPAIDIPYGWGPLLERAEIRVTELAPPFGTFVHGDPNPENIMWREDGELEIRLIDPKDWWIGDPLYDIAKIGHYLRVTGPVEQGKVQASRDDNGQATIIEYDAGALDAHAKLEKDLVDAYEGFATAASGTSGKSRDPSWRERYDFAVASNLLGIVANRAEKGESDDVQRHLAWIAFGEGMRLLEQRLR